MPWSPLHRVLVFPAYAGMFRRQVSPPRSPRRFPRIRGDVPRPTLSWSDPTAFSPHTRGCSSPGLTVVVEEAVFPTYAGMFRQRPSRRVPRGGFPRIRGDVPEARPAMRKILLKLFSQQGSLFDFQTFRSGDHIKLAPTFTKPKVDFLCPN